MKGVVSLVVSQGKIPLCMIQVPLPLLSMASPRAHYRAAIQRNALELNVSFWLRYHHKHQAQGHSFQHHLDSHQLSPCPIEICRGVIYVVSLKTQKKKMEHAGSSKTIQGGLGQPQRSIDQVLGRFFFSKPLGSVP